MGIQQKQNLEHLFNKVFDKRVVQGEGAISLHLSDGTTKQYACGDKNQDAMTRMVRECKEKGLYITGIDIAGDAHINKVNDWLRALGGIAGRLIVRAHGYGGMYVVYLKPKH